MTYLNRSIILTVSIAALMSAPAMANAQERGGPPANDGWSVSVGGGAIYSPNYLGDDDYALSVVPSIRVEYGDRFFASVENGVGYALINNDTLRAGPLMTIDFGREEDGDGPFRVSGDLTQDLVGLGDIDATVSLGGYVEWSLTDNVSLDMRAGQAVGGHDGLTGQLGLSYSTRIQGNGPPVILSLGPNIKFGDGTYADALFGVTAAQSLASGLPVHDASGGIISYGGSATAIVPMTNRTSLTFLASYDRLSGDIADAPLVRLRGSQDQAFMGVIASYRFR